MVHRIPTCRNDIPENRLYQNGVEPAAPDQHTSSGTAAPRLRVPWSRTLSGLPPLLRDHEREAVDVDVTLSLRNDWCRIVAGWSFWHGMTNPRQQIACRVVSRRQGCSPMTADSRREP